MWGNDKLLREKINVLISMHIPKNVFLKAFSKYCGVDKMTYEGKFGLMG